MNTLALRPARTPLSLIALAVATGICLPALYVAYLALAAGPALWGRLWQTRIPELLWNTAALAIGVAGCTVVLGVSLAWIVVRHEFPGRRIWEWALVLPLAMPTYVLAYVYSYLLGFGGPVEQLWQTLAGADSRIISPHSYAGATLVMTLDTFPFVYLLTRTALMNFNVSFEEVARACGVSRWRTLWRVTLPLIRPAIVAGLSLVILYVVSDFGAVSLLRYQTFTYAVYQQMTGRFDQSAASVLSLLLVVFALMFLLAERWFRRRSRFFQTTGRFRRPARGTARPVSSMLITAYLVLVLGASFGGPAILLVTWSLDALGQGVLDSRFIGFVWNSVILSVLAATLAVLVGTPLAYLATRRPSRFNVACLQAAYAGYILPGPVVALALLALATQFVPFVYGTVVVLVVAYIVHYLPAGLQTMEPALQQITPNMEEASRSLGLSPLRSFVRITLPLVSGGFIAAWVLMFLQSMKELPATLLLRPVGFDTLAVRIWLEASEEFYQLAAPSALLIVVMALPALMLLIRKDWRAA